MPATKTELSPQEAARRELKRILPGDTLVDEATLGIYSTDASIYQFAPVAVVTPRGPEDIAKVMRVAREFGVPVTPRGGGTSLAGQAANEAIVIDVSKHMNRILEIDIENQRIRVEPGLVRDELNKAIADHGLEFGPETSTSNRAAVGGMIANNSSGMHSIRYGRTADHLLEATVMLSDGEIVAMKPRSQEEIDKLAQGDTREGELWRAVRETIGGNRAMIEEKFPKVMRRVGGYSLDEFPEGEDWNLAKLIGGSEGTLGILLDATLRLVELPKRIGLVAIHYDDLFGSLRTVPKILEHDPFSVELVDSEVLELAMTNPGTARLCGFLVGKPEALLTVELTGDTEDDLREKMDRFVADMKENDIGYAWPAMTDPLECKNVVELRKAGLGILLGMRGDYKPIPFVEDACVPPDRQAEYLERVRKVCDEAGFRTALFGHASVGVVHIRPIMNMKDPDEVAAMAPIARQVMELVREYKGSWSGEHGDGISRGFLNTEFWGEEMIQVFRDVRKAFDPDGLMNPGRVFDTPDITAGLRYGGEYKAAPPETYFRFEADQGFARAVEMCNGVGACRKMMVGTLCPSYMATRDEEASTRGRANTLRLAISGQLGPEGLVGERVHEVLDLCLECKACKTECPSAVDMAKMKSEHLQHYQDVHGKSTRSLLFAHFPILARMASGPLAPIANFVNGIPLVAKTVSKMIGIAPQRHLPKFATKKLSTLFKESHPRKTDGEDVDLRRVVLFGDCWANYNDTKMGMDAVRVLERLGYRVELVTDACCQRTRISKGFLREARMGGAKTVELLHPYARKNIPILGLEPSCTSSLTDDLPDLVPNKMHAQKVAEMTFSIEEFIAVEAEAGRIEIPKGVPAEGYLIHGHCHQKSLFSTKHGKYILAAAADGEEPGIEEVDSGCCGMAGSFGYEAEHYDISQKIGDMRLFPAVEEQSDDTVIVANGFSCRHQVEEATGRKPQHIIEAFARALFNEHD